MRYAYKIIILQHARTAALNPHVREERGRGAQRQRSGEEGDTRTRSVAACLSAASHMRPQATSTAAAASASSSAAASTGTSASCVGSAVGGGCELKKSLGVVGTQRGVRKLPIHTCKIYNFTIL